MKKSPSIATYCFIGMSLFFAFAFLLALGIIVFHSSMEQQGVLFAIIILECGTVGCGILTACLGVEYSSKVEVTTRGIVARSRFFHDKELLWSECRFAGIYGYYYGLNGTVLFSAKRHVCLNQADCKRISNIDKEIIRVEYSQKLMQAVRDSAPADIVSQLDYFLEKACNT